jgi:hypothetical protein
MRRGARCRATVSGRTQRELELVKLMQAHAERANYGIYTVDNATGY